MSWGRFLLFLCFLLSGAAALVYEVIWQRMLTLVLGVSTWSIAAVLTAYMAGLALGAYLFGRLADRVAHPVRLYAGIELLIGITGLAVSGAIDPLMAVYVRLAGGTGVEFPVAHLIRFGLALAVFIVPCTLIGATIPVMSRIVVRTAGGRGVGAGFGWFYAVNTFGAVAGAGVAGFWLLRDIGMHATIYVAFAGNVSVAALAFLVGWRFRATLGERPLPKTSEGAPPAQAPNVHRRFALLAAAIVGFVGLGYEVAWARLLAVYTLNSIYVFTMILTVYLAGLALGSAVAAALMRRPKHDVLMSLAVVQILLAITCPLVLGFTRLAARMGGAYVYQPAARVFFVEYEMVAAVVFVPTLLLGMTLPLLVALFAGESRGPGVAAGRVYAANSVGTLAGSAISGIVLIPALGLRTTLLLFALTSFVIGCWAIARSAAAPGRVRRTLIPIGATVLVALSILTPYGTRFIRPDVVGDVVTRYYAEGDTAIVHITQLDTEERRDRTLYVDSQSVAGTTDRLITDQKMLAHLPLLLHPAPQRALTVGFGTGGTSYAMLLHGVETHCVEIERCVPAAARFFPRQNLGWVGLQQGTSGREDFRLIVDDARSWLHLAPDPYDVIVDDLTSIQYRGNGNLYTVECFALIKKNLTARGVGCAWVPITGVAPEALHMVVRSFRAVFPHTSIWYMNNLVNDFVILVGTPEPLQIDLGDWQRRMSDPDLAEDLRSLGLDDPLKLASCLLLTEADLDCFVGRGPLHTDDRPLLDYLTHAGVLRDTLAYNLRLLAACFDIEAGDFLLAPPGADPQAERETWRRWRRGTAFVLEGHACTREEDVEGAAAAYRQAAELVPEDPGIAALSEGRQGGI